MTLATYVEMPTPRRAMDGEAQDLLPADLTVAYGAGDAAVAGSVPLHEFLKNAGTLTLADRLTIVGQALLMLEGNYVHLPLKSAMHAVNPVQRLRLLRARLQRQTDGTMDPERIFHMEMSAVFHSVRDLHTNYLLPAPFAGMIAYLPFQVERCVEDGEATYVVSRIAAGLSSPTFQVGTEITHWNGMPIDRAVAVNADRFAGSNVPARLARGIDSLTVRSLRLHLPPDEEWVTVSYVDNAGVRRELREPWLVAPNAPAMAAEDGISEAAAAMGLDLHADETGRARALLYAPRAVEQSLGTIAVEVSTEPAAAGADVPSTMPLVFRARSVVTQAGTFGHLRIFTFNVPDPEAFVDEFVRLAQLLPQEGLILDVRGNGGGHIYASEFTLQTLTPRRITPEPVQFVCTPSTSRSAGGTRTTRPTGSTSAPGSRRWTSRWRPAASTPRPSRSPPRTAPTPAGRSTSDRSSWSPMPAATRRPTSSPRASRTTRSATSWGSTTTPAPAGPTCGRTACSRLCGRCLPTRTRRTGRCRSRRTCASPSAGRCGSDDWPVPRWRTSACGPTSATR
ncbi:hypothetical protein MVA48_02620 [Blastococcus sp. PRF04-17]|nr:hypothetical protein [Blastococcus sp. PRF04-17]UOY02296.1 hypothetical protein MVA48_02620 [Blastococcus sp. PRF04-17]